MELEEIDIQNHTNFYENYRCILDKSQGKYRVYHIEWVKIAEVKTIADVQVEIKKHMGVLT